MTNYKFIGDINESYKNNWAGTSKYYIWDEIEYAKLVIQNGKNISNHMFKDVFLLAKYYHHVEKVDDDKLIKIRLEKLIRIERFPFDVRLKFKELIDGAISGSKKQLMKICHEIRITENEIELINNLPDNTTRKIAFTMLCMWKANGNKPYRASIHQIANEISVKANGKKLGSIFHYLLTEGYVYRYNKKAERRRQILEKMIEVDSQYGQLFIPYDSLKYAEHLFRPTRKSSIAIWRYEQDYYETPYLKLPSYYENMTPAQKEEYKANRYRVIKHEHYGDVEYDEFFDRIDRAFIIENIELITHCWLKDDFAHLIGGDVFYEEHGAHDKIKVLVVDSDCSDGILINVNELSREYDKLFGSNKVIFGNCTECGCKIVKRSNKTKYCDECKGKVRNHKVKMNMRNMRSKEKEN
ncbi:hypothetical protein [Bacillus sp. OTU530]|uniref:hypothetical protein n=1 Tax=Bacillus sp. OTU530 TaxID=3043862 RepID=UPI00313C4360